jgi:hypothetical protein
VCVFFITTRFRVLLTVQKTERSTQNDFQILNRGLDTIHFITKEMAATMITLNQASTQLKAAGLTGHDVRIAFFDRCGEENDFIFKCKECAGVYKSRNGNSNLVNHASNHEGWLAKIAAAKSNGGPLDQYVQRKVSPKAVNLFRWMEHCVMNDEPFDFVENQFVLKNSRNTGIHKQTLVKYLELVREKVETKLKAIVNAVSPKRFGLIFDSWTCNSEHYTAIFITWTDDKDTVQLFNLCCGVQDESEADDLVFTAEAMGDYFVDELQIVGLNLFEHIDFVCGDNCAVNKRFATLITNKILHEKGTNNAWSVPLVGCASHRLNLARQDFYSSPDNAPAIEKVDQLMTKLRTLKNSSKLRKMTHLRAENQNSTRWTSINAALTKYKRLELHLPNGGFDEDTLQCIPTAIESSRISAILASDASFASASRALQRGGDNQLEMTHVRSMFDKLIQQHPRSVEKLGPKAEVVHSSDFESAICKIQALDERLLSVTERKAVKRFLMDENDAVNAPDTNADEDHERDWAQDIIDSADAHKRRKLFVSKYRSTKHVAPTSNVCERIFSRAKLVMRPHRKHMSPFHLEMMIFLRCNKGLWNEATVEDCFSDEITNTVPAAVAAEENA